MKLPNWLKIIWWGLLLIIMIYLFHQRYPCFIDGSANLIDLVIFIILLVLIMFPLFEEISLFGFSFKKEINRLRENIKEQVTTLKNEIHSSINVSPQFIYPLPPPDSQLPDLEERIKLSVSSALNSQGIKKDDFQETQINTPEAAQYLFNVRFNIEKELRRVWNDRFGQENTRRSLPLFQITKLLANSDLIPSDLIQAIREVYSVCTPAIHGENVSEAQLEFVKDIAPVLIETLQIIK